MKFFFFLLFFNGISQNLDTKPIVQVHYLQEIKLLGPSSKYQTNSILTANATNSLYEIDHARNLIEDNVNNDSENLVINTSSDRNEYVFKDIIEKKAYYVETVEFQYIPIMDSIFTSQWNLEDEFERVLGYQCQKATCSYGGRYYTAWFTPDIPFMNGPWRFHGLPGLILNIQSDDGAFSILATSIAIQNQNINIENPYKDKSCMDWNSFLAYYRQRYDAVRRNSMESWGPSVTLPKKSIVEYIKN